MGEKRSQNFPASLLAIPRNLRSSGTLVDFILVIASHPEKSDAITKMKSPTSVPELRRFLGMANQLAGKFCEHFSPITPKCLLLSTYFWSQMKAELSNGMLFV